MRQFKWITVCLLLAILLTVGAIPAFAESGNVTYSGNSGSFIFAPGSDNSPTDLFPNFKDVMPGDSISQTIKVKNNANNRVKVEIYMRALGAHEESEAFLSQLGLRVKKETNTNMFNAAANETAQLTDWVLLGTLYSGGETELKVILDVPTSLDNNHKKEIGYLDWQFMVRELPIESTDPEPPTGGESQIGWYIGLMVGSGLIILLLLLFYRKKKRDENA